MKSQGINVSHRLYFPIEKMEMVDGCLMLSGIGTAEVPDGDDEVMDYESVKKCIPDFKRWSNLREMHGKKAAGTITDFICDDAEKLVRLVCKVVAPDAIKLCMERVYKGLSLGARVCKEVTEKSGAVRLFINRINEWSLVDRPSVPVALFDVQKAADYDETENKERTMKKISVGRMVTKSLGMIQEATAILMHMAGLARWIRSEEAVENMGGGETGPVTAPGGASQHGAELISAAQAQVDGLAAFLVQLTTAETSELTTGAGVEAELEEPAPAGKVEQMLGSGDAQKKGAKYSKETMASLKALHTGASKLVAQVAEMAGIVPEVPKCDKCDKIAGLLKTHKANIHEDALKELEACLKGEDAKPADGAEPSDHPAGGKGEGPKPEPKDGEKPDPKAPPAKDGEKALGVAVAAPVAPAAEPAKVFTAEEVEKLLGAEREKTKAAEKLLAAKPADDPARIVEGTETTIVNKGAGLDAAPGVKPAALSAETEAYLAEVRKMDPEVKAREKLKMSRLPGMSFELVEKLLAGTPVTKERE